MGSFKLEFHVVLVQEYCSYSLWITFNSTCKSKFEEYFFCEWNTLIPHEGKHGILLACFHAACKVFTQPVKFPRESVWELLTHLCWVLCVPLCYVAEKPRTLCYAVKMHIFPEPCIWTLWMRSTPLLVLFSFMCRYALTCARMQQTRNKPNNKKQTLDVLNDLL